MSIKKWGCHAYNLLILSWINGSNNIELYSINKIMGPSLICDYWELEFPYWSPCYAGKDYLPSLTLLCGINYSTCKQIGIPLLTFDQSIKVLFKVGTFYNNTT